MGQIFVTFGSLAIIPIAVNYMLVPHLSTNESIMTDFTSCECFTKNPAEASITTNAYRLLFGLSVAFYINDWIAEVGVGWVYGMMAIFDVVSFFFVILLMWKGHVIREWTVGGLNSTEEGEHVVESNKDYLL